MKTFGTNGSHKIKVMRVIARMNVGGPAIQLSGLYRNLDPEIFDQRLYTGYCSSDEVDYLQVRAKDIAAIRVPTLGRKLKALDDLKAVSFLRSEINEFKPEIIHSHTAKAGLITRIAYLTVRHNATLVHTFHGHILKGYYGRTITKAIVLMEKSLGLFTTKIFAVGQVVLDELVEAGVAPRSKFELMPPGLGLGELKTKSEARDILGLDQTALYCGYIVRVTQVKRPDRFLEVVRECQRLKLGLRFVVAGDGDLLSEIKSQSTDEQLPIDFLGMVAEIELVYAAIDMVVLTSDNEGMPLTLIQAGLARLPSVTTDVGSSKHVVLNSKSGYVSENLSAPEIAHFLSLLTKDQELRQSMGEVAFTHCNSSFSEKRLADDHKRIYLEIIK
jgi:glycosyltransferase involved in cell wall biosynthesis